MLNRHIHLLFVDPISIIPLEDIASYRLQITKADPLFLVSGDLDALCNIIVEKGSTIL